jgi:hypothetical protein
MLQGRGLAAEVGLLMPRQQVAAATAASLAVEAAGEAARMIMAHLAMAATVDVVKSGLSNT